MDLKYEIALCSVWWKKGDIDNRLFDSINEQKAYFDNKITYWSPLSNFPLNDNSVTTISFKDLSSRTIEEVIENNYAVVKKTIDGVETYRYYFAHLFQDSGRVFVCDLELDNIQTNYISIRNALNPCFIRRATIDRFNSDGYFNLEPDSKMFIPEGVSHQQRLIKRDRLKMLFTGNSLVDNWLYENVSGWLYYFVDSTQNYEISSMPAVTPSYTNIKSSLNIIYQETSLNNYVAPYGVMSAPIYKSDKLIYITDNDDNTYPLTTNALMDLLEHNNIITGGKAYGCKFSCVPPICYGGIDGVGIVAYEMNGNLYIRGNQHMINNLQVGIDICKYKNDGLLSDYTALCCMSGNIPPEVCITNAVFNKLYYDFEIDLSSNIELNPNPVGALKDKKFNPKLLNGDYRKLRLVCENSYYEYFCNYLDNTTIRGRYTENILVGNNKCYARISGGIYINETLNNYTGCVSNYDSSLPLVKDKWDEYIANNKNFFIQAGLSYATGLTTSAFAMYSGQPFKASSQAMSSGNAMADAIFAKDNMENAPQSLSGVSGDPLFMIQCHPLGPYFEYYECLDYEMEIDNDYMYFNGYQVNTYGRIQDLDHNRKYFDYIQAELDVIPINISNDEKKGLSQIFRQGIRLWHTDNFEGYTYENYERSLE